MPFSSGISDSIFPARRIIDIRSPALNGNRTLMGMRRSNKTDSISLNSSSSPVCLRAETGTPSLKMPLASGKPRPPDSSADASALSSATRSALRLSALLSAITIGFSPAPSVSSVSITVWACSLALGCVISTTCSRASASTVSSRVARKAATNWVGNF